MNLQHKARDGITIVLSRDFQFDEVITSFANITP